MYNNNSRQSLRTTNYALPLSKFKPGLSFQLTFYSLKTLNYEKDSKVSTSCELCPRGIFCKSPRERLARETFPLNCPLSRTKPIWMYVRVYSKLTHYEVDLSFGVVSPVAVSTAD